MPQQKLKGTTNCFHEFFIFQSAKQIANQLFKTMMNWLYVILAHIEYWVGLLEFQHFYMFATFIEVLLPDS